MKERWINCKAREVRAILAGRKTQTRRVVRGGAAMDGNGLMPLLPDITKCPYGAPGDRLWVRETFGTEWRSLRPVEGDAVYYAADGTCKIVERWRPSIHMPRWASRLTLEVAAVRVERLQDITEADARAEGITDGGCLNCGKGEPCGCGNPQPDARDAFIHLCDSINAERGHGWDRNDWVWVVEFRRVAQ